MSDPVVRYMDLPVQGKAVSHHHYKRFIAEDTDLWLFGTGLGDVTLMMQVGEAFHDYIALHGDPCLGNIMLSIGLTATSLHPYEGDFNVWWSWGSPGFIEDYLRDVSVQPTHVLAPSKHIDCLLRLRGFKPLYLPLGVGKAFKPLGLERKGLGYVGDPIRPQQQLDAIVSPIINRSDFEWISKHASDEWRSMKRLNEWYNGKQIVFGMNNPSALVYGLISNRFYETWASGTPLITYCNPALAELFPRYPYQSENASDTLELIEDVLGDYEEHLEVFQRLSEEVREEHTMLIRVTQLMEWLKNV